MPQGIELRVNIPFQMNQNSEVNLVVDEERNALQLEVFNGLKAQYNKKLLNTGVKFFCFYFCFGLI